MPIGRRLYLTHKLPTDLKLCCPGRAHLIPLAVMQVRRCPHLILPVLGTPVFFQYTHRQDQKSKLHLMLCYSQRVA